MTARASLRLRYRSGGHRVQNFQARMVAARGRELLREAGALPGLRGPRSVPGAAPPPRVVASPLCKRHRRTRDGTPLIRPFALQPSFCFIVSVTMRVCWLASLGYPFPSSPTAARRHGGVYELCNRGSSRTFTCAIRSDSRPQRWALTGPHGRAMSRRQGDAVRVPTFALIIRYSALFPCLNARTRARPRCCGSLTIGTRGRIADG
jgi:hypothetical protein